MVVPHSRFREAGTVKIDEEACKHCGQCAAVCPADVLTVESGHVHVQADSSFGCIACGHCMEECIHGYEGFLRIFRPWVLAVMRPFVRRATYDQFRHFIRPLAQAYVQGHREGRDRLFYRAPAVLIFHHSPYADAADAAIACTYAMLAAESLGLGSTMIGGAPPVIQRNRRLSAHLGIPADHTPSIALILGYPAQHFQRSVRRHFVQVGSVG